MEDWLSLSEMTGVTKIMLYNAWSYIDGSRLIVEPKDLVRSV